MNYFNEQLILRHQKQSISKVHWTCTRWELLKSHYYPWKYRPSKCELWEIHKREEREYARTLPTIHAAFNVEAVDTMAEGQRYCHRHWSEDRVGVVERPLATLLPMTSAVIARLQPSCSLFQNRRIPQTWRKDFYRATPMPCFAWPVTKDRVQFAIKLRK